MLMMMMRRRTTTAMISLMNVWGAYIILMIAVFLSYYRTTYQHPCFTYGPPGHISMASRMHLRLGTKVSLAPLPTRGTCCISRTKETGHIWPAHGATKMLAELLAILRLLEILNIGLGFWWNDPAKTKKTLWTNCQLTALEDSKMVRKHAKNILILCCLSLPVAICCHDPEVFLDFIRSAATRVNTIPVFPVPCLIQWTGLNTLLICLVRVQDHVFENCHHGWPVIFSSDLFSTFDFFQHCQNSQLLYSTRMHRDPGTSCCCWQRRSASSFAVFMRLVCKYLKPIILAKKNQATGTTLHFKYQFHQFLPEITTASQASAQRKASSGRPKYWPYGWYQVAHGAWLGEIWEKNGNTCLDIRSGCDWLHMPLSCTRQSTSSTRYNPIEAAAMASLSSLMKSFQAPWRPSPTPTSGVLAFSWLISESIWTWRLGAWSKNCLKKICVSWRFKIVTQWYTIEPWARGIYPL